MTAPRRVAHVLWRSRGGIRRHVRTVAARPPCGWQTASIIGPPDLAGYFSGLPFAPISRPGLLRPPTDVDLIHVHGVTAGICALAPARPPVVLTVHTVLGGSGLTRRSPAAFLARAVARRAEAIIAVSAEAAEGYPRARIIAPAFDELPAPRRSRDDVRGELGASRDDVVAIVVSRLEDTKRLDVFIAAVEAAGCVGWLVGDGPQREHLQALARGSRTTLLGQRDDVAELLAAADLFALPSQSESYGIAIAEAIAAGLPVVGTSTGAVDELVANAGVLVPVDDADGFLAAVVSLAQDDELRAQRARAARAVVGPDAASLISQLGAVYDEVTRERR